MSNILIFNPNSIPVPNRPIQYLESQDTLSFLGRNDVLFNPTLFNGWRESGKVTNGQLITLSQTELDLISGFLASGQAQLLTAQLNDNISGAKSIFNFSGDKINRALYAFNSLVFQAVNSIRDYLGLDIYSNNQLSNAMNNKIDGNPVNFSDVGKTGNFLPVTGLSSDIGKTQGYNFGFKKVTQTISQSSSVLGDISGLDFSVTSGGYYGFEAFILYYTSHPSCGLSLRVLGPSGAGSTGVWSSEIMIINTQGTDSYQSQNRNSVPTNNTHTSASVNTSGASSIPLIAKLQGSWMVNEPGTVRLQFAPEVNGNTGVILASSWLKWF